MTTLKSVYPFYLNNVAQQPNADLDDAVKRVLFGAFYQSGQSCIGVQRIIIHADVYDRFSDMLVAKTKIVVTGDPKQRETSVGPVAVLSRFTDFSAALSEVNVPSYRVDNMPYGGVKDSGLGREGVRFAMEGMTEIRNLVIRRP